MEDQDTTGIKVDEVVRVSVPDGQERRVNKIVISDFGGARQFTFLVVNGKPIKSTTIIRSCVFDPRDLVPSPGIMKVIYGILGDERKCKEPPK